MTVEHKFGEHEIVDVTILEHHPDNPRRGAIDTIVKSVEQNGFVSALVVQRSTRRVLAGNHRLEAAKQLGYTKIPVIWVDVDDEAAKRILLVDNAAADQASYDDRALESLLKELADSDVGLSGTGFDDLILIDPDDLPKPKPAKLKPFTQSHVLLSYDPSLHVQVKAHLDAIEAIEGTTVRIASN